MAVVRAALVCAAGGALALALRFDLPVCPVAALFAVPCPGCGLTRAAWALLRGEWRAAWALHPLSPVLVPWMAFAGLRAVTGAARTEGRWPQLGGRAGQNAAALLLCALVIGVWGARFGGAFGGPAPVSPLSAFEAPAAQ